MTQPLHAFHCRCRATFEVEQHWVGRLMVCGGCGVFVVVPRESGKPVHVPTLARSTERLEIDLAVRRDWRQVHEIDKDPENYKFEISGPHTARETRRRIRAGRFPSGFKKSRSLVFKVVLRETGKVVGLVPVGYVLPYYSVNLGVVIHHPHAGKGFGREAVAAVTAILFEELGVFKINAMCDSLNHRCVRLLESVGFEREGEARSWLLHPTRGWIDSPYFAMFNPSDASLHAGRLAVADERGAP
ncbi:GNAT family N-acetyltransferase [Verrucomicrobium sp. BvORR106]|uniref:GNAT family N-acetyltransferase n=1 Tax=Verrucomicrobium sp. BvORR106 TaxID=1403819 RepID=UPI000690D7F3|nr:GNAT family N-acetyltransferase [Verrucomicrobium sp. BvORR106]